MKDENQNSYQDKGIAVAVGSKIGTAKIRLRVPMDNLSVFGYDKTNIIRRQNADDGYYNVDIEVPCAKELDMSSAIADLKKMNYKEHEIEPLLDLMLDAVWPEMCMRALKDMIVPVRDGGYAVQEKMGSYSGE